MQAEAMCSDLLPHLSNTVPEQKVKIYLAFTCSSGQGSFSHIGFNSWLLKFPSNDFVFRGNKQVVSFF